MASKLLKEEGDNGLLPFCVFGKNSKGYER